MVRMVSTVVTVLLVIAAVPSGAQPVGFTDIAGTTHEASIRAVLDAEVVTGYPDATFRPEALVTRGQLATFLANALQLPEGHGSVPADVVGTTHETSIRALLDAGLIRGYPDRTFRPEEAVTRGQMASFLANGFSVPADDTPRFLDVGFTTHRASIRAVAGAGIAGGFSDVTYRSDGTVTRGQLTTFLARSLGLVEPATPPGDLRDREAVRVTEQPDTWSSIPPEDPPPFEIPGFEVVHGGHGVNLPASIWAGELHYTGTPQQACRRMGEILQYNGYVVFGLDCDSECPEDACWWVHGYAEFDDQSQEISFSYQQDFVRNGHDIPDFKMTFTIWPD